MILFSGPVPPPTPPLEIQKPIPEEQQGMMQMETFQLKIDQQELSCSAGVLDTGNKAHYAYSSASNRFQNELQIHPARCGTRF